MAKKQKSEEINPRARAIINAFFEGTEEAFTRDQAETLITALVYFEKYKDIIVPALTIGLNDESEGDSE